MGGQYFSSFEISSSSLVYIVPHLFLLLITYIGNILRDQIESSYEIASSHQTPSTSSLSV